MTARSSTKKGDVLEEATVGLPRKVLVAVGLALVADPSCLSSDGRTGGLGDADDGSVEGRLLSPPPTSDPRTD